VLLISVQRVRGKPDGDRNRGRNFRLVPESSAIRKTQEIGNHHHKRFQNVGDEKNLRSCLKQKVQRRDGQGRDREHWSARGFCSGGVPVEGGGQGKFPVQQKNDCETGESKKTIGGVKSGSASAGKRPKGVVWHSQMDSNLTRKVPGIETKGKGSLAA